MRPALARALGYTHLTGWTPKGVHLRTYIDVLHLCREGLSEGRRVLTDEAAEIAERTPQVVAVRRQEAEGWKVRPWPRRKGAVVRMTKHDVIGEAWVYPSGRVSTLGCHPIEA